MRKAPFVVLLILALSGCSLIVERRTECRAVSDFCAAGYHCVDGLCVADSMDADADVDTGDGEDQDADHNVDVSVDAGGDAEQDSAAEDEDASILQPTLDAPVFVLRGQYPSAIAFGYDAVLIDSVIDSTDDSIPVEHRDIINLSLLQWDAETLRTFEKSVEFESEPTEEIRPGQANHLVSCGRRGEEPWALDWHQAYDGVSYTARVFTVAYTDFGLEVTEITEQVLSDVPSHDPSYPARETVVTDGERCFVIFSIVHDDGGRESYQVWVRTVDTPDGVMPPRLVLEASEDAGWSFLPGFDGMAPRAAPMAISDGYGGVVVVVSAVDPTTGNALYVGQRISADGQRLWSPENPLRGQVLLDTGAVTTAERLSAFEERQGNQLVRVSSQPLGAGGRTGALALG